MGFWHSTLLSTSTSQRHQETESMHLPEEILEQIISYCGIDSEDAFPACGHHIEAWRTLASVCLVDKQCCRLAQPVLYRTIKPTDPKGSRRLARTLCRNGELANMVRSFAVSSTQLDDRDQCQDPLHKRDMRAFKAALKPLDNYRSYALDERKILSNIQRGSVDAHLAAALTACTRLHNLSLEPNHRYKETHVGRLLLVASILNPRIYAPGFDAPFYPLPELEHISIKHRGTKGATILSGDHIRQLLFKHNLESFSGHMVELQDEDRVEVWYRFTCGIRRATFTCSLMNHLGMAAFLSSCPKLEAFSLTYGSSTVGDCDIQLHEIGSVLRQHGQSLKRLHLDPVGSFQFDGESFELEHRPLGDLRDLSTLREISVPAVCLIGEDNRNRIGYPHFERVKSMADLLPQSLQQLELLRFDRQDNAEVLGHLHILIRDERLELLQLVTIHVKGSEKQGLLEWLTEDLEDRSTNWVIEDDTSKNCIVLGRL